MRLIAIFVFNTMLIYKASIAQTPQIEKIKAADIKAMNIHLTPLVNKTFHLPFSGIKVIDFRNDSSMVGFFQKSKNPVFKKLSFENSLSIELGNALSKNIDRNTDSTGYSLYCYVLKLYCSDEFYELKNTGDQKPTVNDISTNSGISFKFEFYLKHDDNLIPFLRIDSTVTSMEPIRISYSSLFKNILDITFKSLQNINWEKVLQNGKRLDMKTVYEFYDKKFRLPILNEKPIKGIYYSFTDFLNNRPSADSFIIEKGKKADFIYITDNAGNQKLNTDIWGYCDGEKEYIYSAENFFELVRNQNTFWIWGAKDYSSVRVLRANFRLTDLIKPESNYSKGSTATKHILRYNPYQLDMETGELY